MTSKTIFVSSQRKKNKQSHDPKKLYRAYTEEALQRAVKLVMCGSSLGRASKECGVPKTTISDRVNGKTEADCKPGRRVDIDPAIEESVPYAQSSCLSIQTI